MNGHNSRKLNLIKEDLEENIQCHLITPESLVSEEDLNPEFLVDESSVKIDDLTFMNTCQINRKHKLKMRWLKNHGRAEAVYSEGD